MGGGEVVEYSVPRGAVSMDGEGWSKIAGGASSEGREKIYSHSGGVMGDPEEILMEMNWGERRRTDQLRKQRNRNEKSREGRPRVGGENGARR